MAADDTVVDRWTVCEKGHIHRGALDGAGLLLRFPAKTGKSLYLLEQRSRWVDEGGTWGIPGGAMREGESPEATAQREAEEGIWPLAPYCVTGIEVQDCGGGWRFHVICADVEEPFIAYRGQQTDATGWFTLEEMGVLPLHPGFRRWLDKQDRPGR
jgi:ADP-ribose pyrophosphatase YjhB (NUDIX family)